MKCPLCGSGAVVQGQRGPTTRSPFRRCYGCGLEGPLETWERVEGMARLDAAARAVERWLLKSSKRSLTFDRGETGKPCAGQIVACLHHWDRGEVASASAPELIAALLALEVPPPRGAPLSTEEA